MKSTRMLMIIAAAMLTVTGIASADPNTRGIDRREARQDCRMQAGYRQGNLTPLELRRLSAGRRHVMRMERRAQRDGRMTLSERRRIHRTLDRQSHRIYRLRHNGRQA